MPDGADEPEDAKPQSAERVVGPEAGAKAKPAVARRTGDSLVAYSGEGESPQAERAASGPAPGAVVDPFAAPVIDAPDSGAAGIISPDNLPPQALPSARRVASGEPVRSVGDTFENSLDMKFVPVPGTKVWFSVWDTRVRDYAEYASAAGSVNGAWNEPGFPQTENDPVVNVNWADAKDFCRWLSKQEGRNYRLPTDREWSIAVGLGDQEDPSGRPESKSGRIKDVYPWGRDWPPPAKAGNYGWLAGRSEGLFEHTSPVGAFAANQFGLYDMGGNVCQWCEDWSDANQTLRVLRGGSWFLSGRASLLSSYRFPGDSRRFSHYGFRVVLEP